MMIRLVFLLQVHCGICSRDAGQRQRISVDQERSSLTVHTIRVVLGHDVDG